jgi:putative ABC transport system permease protein
MNLKDQISLARRSLSRHPLRTALTMLGMIIGVASVVIMISLGLGARAQVEEEIERLGTNLLTVRPITRTTDSLRSNDAGQHRITDDDAQALAREIAEVSHAVPVVNGRVRLVYGSNNWQTTVIGTHPDYLPARDWQTEDGRNFTMHDVTGSAKVVLIGKTVQENLSPLKPMLGQIVRINDVPFRVIGVMAEKGQSVNGQDQDNLIISPITTVKSRLLGGYYRENRFAAAYLVVKSASEESLTSVRSAIQRVLRDRHRTRSGARVDFRVRDPVAALSASKTASETLTLLLACIAAVSLLVGGISIMNIMLVSVAERSREIGIRIAVGATRGDVRTQFLVESAGVALLGGTIGAVVGATVAFLVNVIVGWEVLISVWVCLGALSFSAVVGLLSGLYPAFRASALDPLDAIRQQ